jgi:hypothetical protein
VEHELDLEMLAPNESASNIGGNSASNNNILGKRFAE